MGTTGPPAPIAIRGGTIIDAGSHDPGSGSKPATTRTVVLHGSRIRRSVTADSSDRFIDADGLHVSAGFIDLQINGGYGHDLAGDPAGMWALGRRLPRHGVTSFLPTIVSSPPGVYRDAIGVLAQRPRSYRGAEPLGLHFEGPMLSPKHPGAHRPEHLVAPSAAVIQGWSRSRGVMLVTLAPELSGAEEVIAVLRDRNVAVAAGHSAATGTDAVAAADRGVTMVTHVFNAMEPLHHRAPGLAGVALTDGRLHVGLIADGIHVDPSIVALIWRAAGPEQVVLVTDAVAALGLGPGEHRLGDVTVETDGQAVRTTSGALAGSLLTMDAAVRNTARFTGVASAEIVAAATVNPARVIGLTDRGRLSDGSVADVTMLDDEGNVVMTLCAGTPVFLSDDAGDRLGPGLERWADEIG